jgi:hypothetical protein
MNILKTGDTFLHELENGEGMLYEVSEDPINPLKLIKTLSPQEVKQYKK